MAEEGLEKAGLMKYLLVGEPSLLNASVITFDLVSAVTNIYY
jgi:hypothetical protein